MAASSKIILLAHDASSLSADLTTLSTACHHDEANTELLATAKELAQLSDTLEDLNNAVDADPAQYTNAFQRDVKEITDELIAVFAELQDCCTKLGAVTIDVSGVTWFFKKGRVDRLIQRLEALRGTLLVMRTVLWHGKNFGTHQSSRIAESSPHTMHEDRVILESILAQNRDSILDLHNLLDTASNSRQEPITQEEPIGIGKHYKKLSDSTGVHTLSIPDVLPPSHESDATPSLRFGTGILPEPLRHTFSKRGVRLGAHMSILDLSAHEASEGPKKKWIQEANHKHLTSRADKPPSSFRNCGGLTPLPELSKISEVNSTSAAESTAASSASQAGTVPIDNFAEVSLVDTSTPTRELSCPPNTPNDPTSDGEVGKISSKLRHVMRKISKPSLRPSSKIHD